MKMYEENPHELSMDVVGRTMNLPKVTYLILPPNELKSRDARKKTAVTFFHTNTSIHLFLI